MNVKAGVWHQAGFPYQCERVHILCVLPERTYARDCYCFDLSKKDQIEVSPEFIE